MSKVKVGNCIKVMSSVTDGWGIIFEALEVHPNGIAIKPILEITNNKVEKLKTKHSIQIMHETDFIKYPKCNAIKILYGEIE